LQIQEVELMLKVSVGDYFVICTYCTFSWKLSLSIFSIILQAAAGGDEEFFKLEEYGESFIHLSRELDASIISVSYITPSLYFLQQLWQIELLLRSTGFQRRSAGIIPRY